MLRNLSTTYFSISICSFIAMFIATTSQADIINVPDKDNDILTIQHGIDAASNGDTVVVADDTYTGDGNNNLNFTTRTDIIYQRIFATGNFGDLDTLTNLVDVRKTGIIPGQFGIGIMYSSGSKFRVGMNYAYQDWRKYRNDAKPEDMVLLAGKGDENFIVFAEKKIPYNERKFVKSYYANEAVS